jgi:hypothetical protein
MTALEGQYQAEQKKIAKENDTTDFTMPPN